MGENRGEPHIRREQIGHDPGAGLALEVAMEGERPWEHLMQRSGAFQGGRQSLIAGDRDHPLVPEMLEQVNSLPGPLVHRGGYRWHSERTDRLVGEHERRGAGEARQLIDLRGGAARRVDEPVDGARREHREVSGFATRVGVGRARDDETVICLVGGFFDTARDAPEIPVRDVGNGQPDGATAARLQAPCPCVWHVLELVDEAMDAGRRLRVDRSFS